MIPNRPLAALSLGLVLSWTLQAEVSFNRDIRPIMSDTCFRCHGPDQDSRMAGLRLDIREEALKTSESGKTPIVPGKPEASEVIRRVMAEDPSEIMPPLFAHKELTGMQKGLLRQWVLEGAKYEGHWSFQPIQRPSVPNLEDSTSIRNPIDAFVQRRLAQEGLRPSPEADRRTLIRRVTLDLTGLPPTPDEVERFVSDPSPDAYENLVDRLLASPRYAEKQTMLWLDAVRYADTRGFHNDIAQPAWPYRDYVLRSFLSNKPFDVFTREQLAGDLLPESGVEQKIATAYHRILRTSEEGGIQDKEYLAKYGADRVRTTGSVWLGLTMGCAECHDHKFDPITTRDFYSMKAFFADIKENGILPGKGPKAWAATLSLPSDAQKTRLAELDETLRQADRELSQKLEALTARRAEWEQQLLKDFQAGQLKWHYQRPVEARSENGANLTVYNEEMVDRNFYVVSAGGATLETKRTPGNGLVVATGPNPDNETYLIRLKPGKGVWTALGVQAIQDESLPAVRLARGADRFVLSEVEAAVSEEHEATSKRLRFTLATTDGFGEAAENPPMAAIDGDPATGWGLSSGEGKSPFLALRFADAVTTSDSSIMTVWLRQESPLRRATIGRLRLALSAGRYSWPELGDDSAEVGVRPEDSRLVKGGSRDGLPGLVLQALRASPENRSEEQHQIVLSHFQWSVPELRSLFEEREKLRASRSRLVAAIPTVMVTESMEPRETRILPRGNWMDDSGPVVEPAVPGFLAKKPHQTHRGTRLDLANWIVSPENPLAARVFVNRMWRQFFGTGLSKVLDDLGSQGEWPTHPDLLDWLAAEFRQPTWQAGGAHNWDVKRLLRLLVTSHTYRQSSLSTPQLDERDPDNRLLARQSRFRVDAEMVRDIALAVSGLLVEEVGGPSVNPYQPDGYLAAMNFPKRDYSAGRGQDLYRRGLYTFWRRTFLHPSLLAFDAPSREECTVNRINSNTPLQSLVLLNDPIFVEAARVFAQHVLERGGETVPDQIDWAFQQALGRRPIEAERKVLLDLHTRSNSEFHSDSKSAQTLVQVGDAPLNKKLDVFELAAMTTVTRAILNLHETITRN
ncbi:MAG: PSD1 and planctomycete cytochrome C domain-containing protein [Acidobacteriota bacterium]